MKPIPLFGTGIKSLSATITAQRRLNCIYDIRVDQDKTAIAIVGTPGSFPTFTIPDSPIRGWIVVGAILFVVAGKNFYAVTLGGSVTLIGAVPTASQFVTFADNGVQIIFVDGVAGYYHNYTTGIYGGVITDPGFPNGCTTIAALNSRFVAEQPGTRLFSVGYQLAAQTWSPVLFGAKENYSDFIVAVDSFNGLLIFWGTRSTEFWQDASLVPQPYQRIQGSTQTWGLAAKYSRATLNNSMVFLGQNPDGGVRVMKLNGYSPVPISNSDIDQIITSFPIYQDAIALTYTLYGHPLYQITFPNANRSFLYDDSTGIWYEVQTGVGLTARHFANIGINFNSKNYVSDVNTGIVYQLDPMTYTDNGTSIKRQVASRHLRRGGNEFELNEIILEMATGVGTIVGQGVNPQIMMQLSRDGGRTFGAERWSRLWPQGQYNTRVKYDRLGSARDFVALWTMTDPVRFEITLGEALMAPGIED